MNRRERVFAVGHWLEVQGYVLFFFPFLFFVFLKKKHFEMLQQDLGTVQITFS